MDLADIQIQVVAITNKKGENMRLKETEMEKISGGAIASSFINAISKAINTVYQLGKQTGSALRRIVYGKYCPIN